MPIELDEAERRIMQLEIEREALKKETDPASQQRLEALEHELASLKEERDALRSRWDQEREAIMAISELRDEMDRLKVEIEQAQRKYDYNTAAELQYGRAKELEQRLRLAERDAARCADQAVDRLQVDHRILLRRDEEEIVLLVLEEQVLGVAAIDLAAQRLRIGDGEEGRMRNRLGFDAEVAEIGKKIVGAGGHGRSVWLNAGHA